MITNKIKSHYIGGYERLTQAKMEDFFRNDANFVEADVGFFTPERARVYGY